LPTATFDAGDPAKSFSKKTGIAILPNKGEALIADLQTGQDSTNYDPYVAHRKANRRSSVVIPYGSFGGGLKVIGK
jgi:hypothetical protein